MSDVVGSRVEVKASKVHVAHFFLGEVPMYSVGRLEGSLERRCPGKLYVSTSPDERTGRKMS